MDIQSQTILSLGTILLLLAIIWAWTTIKTKSLDGQIKTAIAGQKTEGEITLAKFQLEGCTQKNSTKTGIAALREATDLRRIEADKDFHDKQLLLQAKSLDVQLDQEKLRQDGNNSRAQLKHQTRSEIAGMELSFRNKELNSRQEMFQESLKYKFQKLKEDGVRYRLGLELKKDAISSNERNHRYLADKRFEGIALSQRHEDERHQGWMGAQKTMHQGSLELKKSLGLRSIESNEKIQMEGFNCRRYEAGQATSRSEIEAESSSNIFTALLGTVVNVAGGSLIPKLRGGGGSGENATSLLSRQDFSSNRIQAIRKK